MSSSQVEIEGGVDVASRIAADAAFSALDASGAPLIAAAGEPLTIVYLNASARAVFGADSAELADQLFRGDEPGARRLAELVDSVRHGAALRLERLRFGFGSAPQTLTVLCRRLDEEDEAAPCFVIAALGVRPAASRDAAPPASEEAVAPPQDPMAATVALRARLAERHGPRAPRFLWKTDSAGRFVAVSPVLRDVAGEAGADILGRSVEEVVRRFSLDPAFSRAVAAEKSWSGIEVDWPLEQSSARAPATLGALVATDGDRRFAGFQGYGVLHLARAYVAAAHAPAPQAPPPSGEAESAPFPGANVVPLRPSAATPRAEESESLTSSERSAFEEIARALRAGQILDEEETRDEERDAPQIEASAAAPAPTQSAAPPSTAPEAPMAALLDQLPIGLLIARGARTLFANRALLDYLGYADVRAFEGDGGLARMFFGRPPADAAAKGGAVQSSGGESLNVDVHLQTIEWEGAPATLVTLRRNGDRLPGAEDAPTAAPARETGTALADAAADNKLLRALLDSSGAALAIVGEDGRIESVTEALATLFGVEAEAFAGLPLASLFAPEDGRALTARLSRAGADAAQTLRLSTRGTSRAVQATLRRLGPARKLCVALREADGERRNDELVAAREAAEQASAAKSDFLARISHEIRTPLNAIIGFAEVMMEERLGPIGSERYREYLKDIHASGKHVLSLVNDLLDLSKIEAGKMELAFDRVDANAVISECVSIMQSQANQGRVVMRVGLAENLPPIRADERALKQILLNLLSNAVKFNEPGGQVIVSSALTDAGYVLIRVKDTGIGMSEDEVQTALEPFKQVSHKKPGTGLGLPLTKALIEANQASFTIKSRKNEGTLVEIAFPPPQVLAAE